MFFFFFSFYFPGILYILKVGKFHFYSQEKKSHSPVVKCVSRGNLEIDSYSNVMLSLWIAFLHVCGPAHMHTLHRLPVWPAIAENGAVETSVPINKCRGLPGRSAERFPESTPAHASFCWEILFPLFNQNLQRRWNAGGLICCWGDGENPDLFGAAFWVLPECDTLGFGSVNLALEEVTWVEESLVSTFALFVFQCRNLPSSRVSLFY